jgi:hypothetical protein
MARASLNKKQSVYQPGRPSFLELKAICLFLTTPSPQSDEPSPEASGEGDDGAPVDVMERAVRMTPTLCPPLSVRITLMVVLDGHRYCYQRNGRWLRRGRRWRSAATAQRLPQSWSRPHHRPPTRPPHVKGKPPSISVTLAMALRYALIVTVRADCNITMWWAAVARYIPSLSPKPGSEEGPAPPPSGHLRCL